MIETSEPAVMWDEWRHLGQQKAAYFRSQLFSKLKLFYLKIKLRPPYEAAMLIAHPQEYCYSYLATSEIFSERSKKDNLKVKYGKQIELNKIKPKCINVQFIQ